MGREMRRVPLDFDAPLGQVWEGYVNPHSRRCDVCEGHGDTASSRFLMDWLRILPIAAEESLCGTPEHLAHYAKTGRIYPHPDLQAEPMCVESAEDLGDQLWDLVERLNGAELRAGPFGLSETVNWNLYRRLLEFAGLPEDWGHCPACQGSGMHPDAKEAYDAWEHYDPPTGEGFQLWNTTGAGAPKSPVFETIEELAAWCERGSTICGTSEYLSKEEWLKMFKKNFCYHRDANGTLFT